MLSHAHTRAHYAPLHSSPSTTPALLITSANLRWLNGFFKNTFMPTSRQRSSDAPAEQPMIGVEENSQSRFRISSAHSNPSMLGICTGAQVDIDRKGTLCMQVCAELRMGDGNDGRRKVE
mmetsp:Transcript_34360/g.88835  ORF Transcript_34360/g.88835 Transcript_34360/m.88835 type:complete len:120 (+) Transcript_34360:2977-3336(+)